MGPLKSSNGSPDLSILIKNLLDADCRGSQAFARALERAGILTADEREKLVAAFEQIRTEAREPKFLDGATDEDVHTFVIRKLKEKVAGPGRQNPYRPQPQRASIAGRAAVAARTDRRRISILVSLMAALSAWPANIRMPSCPAIRICAARKRCRGRIICWRISKCSRAITNASAQARARVDVMPLGSGALAGSGFPFDREQIARDLGFAAITRNSMDVSGDRDFALDFLYAASISMLHLSRLAEDWILYSSEEFGWLELGDGVTSGSSLMPQKKNPDSLELIRGKSGRVFGDFTSLFVTMKGLPMTYNRDMQEDKEPLFDAAAQLSGVARDDGCRGRIHAACMRASRSKRLGELGGGHRPGRSAGARRNALSSRASNCRQTGAGKHPARQTADRLDRRAAHCFRAGIHRRHGAPAGSARRNEDARTSWRRGTGRSRAKRSMTPKRGCATGGVSAMNKAFRQGQILKLIRSKRIPTQEDLARELSRAMASTPRK